MAFSVASGMASSMPSSMPSSMAPSRKPVRGSRGTARMAPKLRNAGIMMIIVMVFHLLFSWVAAGDSYFYYFLCLFTWRYLRFLINLAAFWRYSPTPEPMGRPSYLPSRDVTVIIPTVDPEGKHFVECLRTCAQNKPRKIVVVVAGDELFAKALSQVREVARQFKSTRFIVDLTQVASKREQVARAMRHVETDITVALDDHAFWGPKFLETMLRPFESPEIGLVGCNKRVRRIDGLNPWARFWNMLGATYLMRHNFEIRASNAVDGGVFVVSGRSFAIRTEILRHPEFMPGYTNEKFFFRKLGPLNPDDDNYITRFVVRHGWKIKIQYAKESEMITTIGTEYPLHTKFLGQCKRWSRTTWRSNLSSLITDRTVWVTQPYCVYAVYLTSLTNFAAVTDPSLIYLLTRSSLHSTTALACLVSWILFTKLPKIFPYFRRYPQDTWLLPFYILFAYFHSLVKLWALLTFWDCSWSGRSLNKINVTSTPELIIEHTTRGPHQSPIPSPHALQQSPQQHNTPNPHQQQLLDRSTLSYLRARVTMLQAHHTQHTNPELTQQHHAAIDALCARITDLQTRHAQAQADNKQGTTAQSRFEGELQALKGELRGLKKVQGVMMEKQMGMKGEVERVMVKAVEMGVVLEARV